MKLAKGEHDTQLSKMTQCEQDTYEMHVRAANIVRAGESLMKLVSDIKQYLILNDFPSVNEAITQNSKLFRFVRLFGLMFFDLNLFWKTTDLVTEWPKSQRPSSYLFFTCVSFECCKVDFNRLK